MMNSKISHKCVDHPKDVDKFADLLDIARINLKEENRIEELGKVHLIKNC